MKEKISAPARLLHLFIVVALTSSLLSFISVTANAVPPETCANGGPCQPGDIGPGGGLVFYSDSAGFSCGPTFSDTCNYLEVATSAASPGWQDTGASFTGSQIPNIATRSEIGAGYQNSLELIARTGDSGAPAASLARNYTGGGLTDWYLPSSSELLKLYDEKNWVGGFSTDYWGGFYGSSTRAGGMNYAPLYVHFSDGSTGVNNNDDSGYGLTTRAIRSFAGPALTGDTRVYRSTIPEVTVPVRGDTPVTTGITTGLGYTGTISWSNSEGTWNTNFDSETVYTANIELTPSTGYTFDGVPENYFIVPGATSTTNDANSGTITAVFPATANYYNGSDGIEDCGTSGTYTIVNNTVTTSASCSGNVEIPEGITGISASAFSGNTITSLTISNSVLTIGDQAFAHSSAMTSLTLGNNLTTLVTNTFYNFQGALTTFRYCGYGVFNFSDAGLGAQIAPSCILTNEVNGVAFEISSELPINEDNFIHLRLSDINLIDSLTVTAMSGGNVLAVTPEYVGCGDNSLASAKTCINQNLGSLFEVTYRASDGNDPNLASITFTVQSVPDYAPEITYRQPIYKGRSEPEVQIDTAQPYTFLSIGGQESVITHSDTETVNGLFENNRYRIYTGETGLKVKQIWTTADADTHINFHGIAPNSGTVTVTIKVGAFNAAYPAYISNALVIPVNGCDGITAVCVVDDVGPGGGKIFYVEAEPTGFASLSPECRPRCRYLEAAPISGYSSWSDSNGSPGYAWSGETNTALGTTGTAIGTGYQNTSAIINQENAGGASAASGARFYSGGNQYDWFLPSKDELNELFTNRVSLDAESPGYWSSSESNATQVWIQAFTDGEQGQAEKSYLIAARPIRAFGYVTPAAILGVTAPVKDATPVVSVEEGNGYTGTITWASDAGALDGNFQPGTIYTATITLTAKENYSFSGITENYFTVESAAATNSNSSGVVTAVFASTGAGAPVQIEIWDGNDQNAVIGNIVADPLEVRVTDADGNPVPDVSVSLIGDGTIFDDTNQVITSVQTDASGYAFVPRWRLPETRGEASLTATISTASGTISVLFTATANRRPAAYDESTVSVSLNSILANGSSTSQIMIQAKDENGFNITEGGDIFGIQFPSTGMISGVTDNGDGTYTATYTSGLTPGSVEIIPEIDGVAFQSRATITLTDATGLPSQIFLEIPAAGALDERPFITQPRILIRDVHGNTVTSDGSIGYYINLGDETVSFGTIDYFAGVASASNIAFDGTPGMTYTIRYDSEGLTAAQPQTIYLGKACNGVNVSCLIGDMGPGGGIVFYIDSSANGFTSDSPGCSAGCRYLEAAIHSGPDGWIDTGPGEGEGYVWSENSNRHFGGTQTSIGSGYANTTEIISDDEASISTASSVARAYEGSGMSDWYLPSLEELEWLFNKTELVGLLPAPNAYWSSSEMVYDAGSPGTALTAFASSGETGENPKSDGHFVRPIRAFAGPPPACYTVINRIVTDSQSCSGIVEIPDDIIAIANDALSGSDSVSELVIGNGVQTIGANAFRGLYDLTDLTLGSSIQTISAGAFRDATSLRALVIPDSVEVIGDSAFRDARRMLSLTLGNSIQTIEERAFFDARKIQSLMIPDSVEVIEFEAFAQTFDLRSLTLGNGLHTIQNSAFRYAARLTTINFGTGLRTIGANAFEGDEGSRIASLVIPDSVITIGNRAFGSASSLVSLTIGKNVETLGEDAFSYSDELLSYTYCGTLLTEEDLADAGLGGKERLACPQAPATNQVSSPTPNPRQLSKVFAINPTSAVSPSTIPVTISGEFVETVVNIAINGTSLQVGAWKQTRNEISFLMPSKKVGTYLIQLYNGSSPLLDPIAFIFTLTPEVKPESPAIDVSNKPDSEKSQGSGVTTNLTGPESKKPLQNILTTKIYFDMGSSAINLLNRKSLQNFAKRIAGLGTSISVSVKGFAQPTPGSQKTDQALSKKRASNVAQLLRNFGVNTRVTYAGAGRALLNVPKSRYVEIIAANK